MYLLVMVGKKYWYIMYYITYQYLTLDTVCLHRGSNPGRLHHRWALYLKRYLGSLVYTGM
jgi:hypothetical protein